MVMTVERLNISTLILIFVFYLICHIVIGVYKKKLEYDSFRNPNDYELKKQAKIYNMLFKWFPALYLVATVLMLYVIQ